MNRTRTYIYLSLLTHEFGGFDCVCTHARPTRPEGARRPPGETRSGSTGRRADLGPPDPEARRPDRHAGFQARKCRATRRSRARTSAARPEARRLAAGRHRAETPRGSAARAATHGRRGNERPWREFGGAAAASRRSSPAGSKGLITRNQNPTSPRDKKHHPYQCPPFPRGKNTPLSLIHPSPGTMDTPSRVRIKNSQGNRNTRGRNTRARAYQSPGGKSRNARRTRTKKNGQGRNGRKTSTKNNHTTPTKNGNRSL